VSERTGVLFVCLGNICRSPLAEGIFIHMARERGVLDRFEVDSCGTGAWHVGEPADHRSIDVARRHGIELPSIARQVNPERDFAKFEWIIAMDRANVRSLMRSGAPAERVRLMRSFDPAMIHRPEHEMDVPDPYDWPGDGFEEVYQMLHAACGGLLEYLVED
jgi:protein-tyrosine phosphatase